MILEVIKHKEYHPSGTLWIDGEIGIIAPMWRGLYDYRESEVRHGKGKEFWCRIGIWTKHYDNGQFAWQISYNENGFHKKDNSFQFTKDGTIIKH